MGGDSIKEIDIESIRRRAVQAGIKVAHLGEEKMGNAFLRTLIQASVTMARPDRAFIKCGLLTTPCLVVEKILSQPLTDAWGVNVRVDRLAVEQGQIAAYHGQGEATFVFSKEIDEVMQQEFPFLIITPEQHEMLLRITETYLVVDLDDVLGPRLRAVYPARARDDTPDKEWNKAVRVAREADKQRLQQWEAKEAAKARPQWEEGIRKCQELGAEILESDFSGGVILFRLPERKEVRRWVAQSGLYQDIGKSPWLLAEAIQKYKISLRNYSAWQETAERVRRGEIPVLACGTIEIFYTGKQTIEVPLNLIGHFIGRERRVIKALQRAVGHKIDIQPIDPVDIDTRKFPVNRSPGPQPELYLPGKVIANKEK